MIETIIIGPGRMGSNYGRILKNDSRIKIIAVCGRSVAKTLELANELNCAAYPEENYKDAFSTFSLNAKKLVVIATSEWEHLKPLKFAINSKSAIIIEKPLLGSYNEFLQIKNDLLELQRPILPCFTSRFDPRYYEAHNLVRKNKLKPVTIHSRRNTDYLTASRVYGKINWPYWIIVHDIDLIRWFSGCEVFSVVASSRFKGKLNKSKDYLQVELEMVNGSKAFIESSWFLPPLTGPTLFSEFRFQSESSSIELTTPASVSFNKKSKYSTSFPDDFQSQNGRLVGNTPNMINHFIDVVASSATPFVSLFDGINALKVSEAVLQSLKSDSRIYLNEIL